uniref:NADH-ubiquinone oxidoreductase chain 4L n=2 Tax=Peirates TaxID=181094 RepID=A0A0C4K3F1_9HEMI|nr:NADH dehydrogenase subunit 4L [Peirates fulvescens]AHH93127.1 NADH dehydrogenase subunit 4L [Peirates fulvescens]AHH93153.1 NADH dehydrogenase subunit 4L [Peirates atromaculatus]
MNFFLFVIWFMFFSGLFVFCSMRSHLLLTLLSLEFLSMCLYISMFSFLFTHNFSYYFLLVYLVFVVCEGVLGLGILISMIRSHGNDYISGLSILGW